MSFVSVRSVDELLVKRSAMRLSTVNSQGVEFNLVVSASNKDPVTNEDVISSWNISHYCS